MNRLILLAKQQLRVTRLSVWVWSGLFLLMGLGVATAAPTVVSGNSAEEMLKALGMGKLVGDGPSAFAHPADWYLTYKMLAWLSQFGGIFAAITALQIVLKEEDNRTAEFLLSLPLRRETIAVGRLMALFASITVLVASCVAGLVIGAVSVKVDISTGRYLMAGLGAVLTSFAIGTLSLLVSLFFRSYGKALRYSLGITSGLFLYDIVIKFASPDLAKGWLGKITPFGWIDATTMIKDGDPQTLGIAATLAASLVLGYLAVRLYDRREVN